MKNIVILKSRLSHLGGLERYALEIALAFSKKGHKVTLLTTGALLKVDGVNVISFGKHPKLTFFSLIFFEKQVKKWLRNHPQDIVFGLDRNCFQTHFRAGNGSHYSFLSKTKAPLSHFMLSHFSLKNRLIISRERKLFTYPLLTHLFTNSNRVKQDLIKQYAVDPKKIKVVYNGVNKEAFDFDEHSQKAAQEKLKLNKSKIQLLFVGHNYKRKGLLFLLKALRNLRSDAFHLMIVGADKHSKKYEQWATENKLEKQVSFFGPQKDLPLFYRAADVFILPTQYDPFANVTLEALFMGLYVITTTENGASEIIQSACGDVLQMPHLSHRLVKSIEQLPQYPLDYAKKNQIRQSVEHLDLKTQMDTLVNLSLS